MKGQNAYYFVGCLSAVYFGVGYFLARLSIRSAQFLNPLFSGLMVFLLFTYPASRKGWSLDILWPLPILLLSCLLGAGLVYGTSKHNESES